MRFGILEFGILILGFWACDLELRKLGLEFCSLGVWVWDSVLEFGVWCLELGIFEIRISCLGFCVWDLDFQV